MITVARRISLPRLTRRQRLARWQRERRQQVVIVTIFSAVLFFALGLVAWAGSDRYYQANLKPAARLEGRAIALRDFRREQQYQLIRFFVDFGVPSHAESDPQLQRYKNDIEVAALDKAVEFSITDRAAREMAIAIPQSAIEDRFKDEFFQFRSRHVLIKPDDKAQDKDAAERAALEKAKGVAAQLRANPQDAALWAKLAKEVSDDTGTKERGGELGWVGHNQFVKPFEDAVRTLQPGQVSDPVKSGFGYHVIQLEELRPPEASDLVQRWLRAGFSIAQVKAHVRHDLVREEITKRLQETPPPSPAPHVHLAKILVNTPLPGAADFQSFSDALKKLSDANGALEKGTDFAEVATKFSEDTATAEKGGDMGWVARGMITDVRAEDDVFALQPGTVSARHATRTQTTIYKVLERDDSRELTDDQRTKIKDGAFDYWYARQKRALDVIKLLPGLEFD